MHTLKLLSLLLYAFLMKLFESANKTINDWVITFFILPCLMDSPRIEKQEIFLRKFACCYTPFTLAVWHCYTLTRPATSLSLFIGPMAKPVRFTFIALLQFHGVAYISILNTICLYTVNRFTSLTVFTSNASRSIWCIFSPSLCACNDTNCYKIMHGYVIRPMSFREIGSMTKSTEAKVTEFVTHEVTACKNMSI